MTPKELLRRPTTLVICPNCKGHGVTEKRLYNFFAPPIIETCTWCRGAQVLGEVVELRRVEK